jgi:hypothetical protein
MQTAGDVGKETFVLPNEAKIVPAVKSVLTKQAAAV